MRRASTPKTRTVCLLSPLLLVIAISLILTSWCVPIGYTSAASGNKAQDIEAAHGMSRQAPVLATAADSILNGKVSQLSHLSNAEAAKRIPVFSPEPSLAVPQVACGFVNAPADPSPMDCYTKLVANHDTVALGTRIPVILIHGIHGNDGSDPQNYTNDGYFANLIGHLNSNASFRERFKIYRFHYRSDYLPIYQISRSLRNRIDDLVKQNPQLESKKFVLIAHSMGGLVARSYMNEHDTDYGSVFKGRRAGERITKLITLATPHHGTVVANDKSRVSWHPAWGLAFDAFDFVYWQYKHGCSDCNDDPSHPNRSDLRFDNYNGLWNSNSAYVNDPKEQNTWLQNVPKTYDRLISAYYGYIGGNSVVSEVGQLCPADLTTYFINNKDNNSAVQIATGVLIARIEMENFGTPPIDCGAPTVFLYNDGLVSADSAMYAKENVGKKIQCGEYNHEDMKDGVGGNCTVIGTSIKKPLFDLIMDDLFPIQVSIGDSQPPSVTINLPTSNATHSTSSSSINLSGMASDNIGVTKVTWTNDRGGSGTASGTDAWSINGIALKSGANTLTVSAQDAAGNIGKDILTVSYTVTTTDTTPPVVKITTPTSSSTYPTTGSTLTLKGTATDNVGVTQVTWTNNRGGSGTASGTTNWSASVTGLQSGTNVLTVRARDAAGNSSTASLTVTYTPPPVCDGGTSENYRVNGGPPLHPNGTLIKLRNDPTVFLIQNGLRRGIPTQAILNNLYQQPNGGFQNKDVIIVAADEFNRFTTGAVINSALPSNGRSHPDGRLIQRVGGSEISIISGGVRRPFASESTFLGLGYLYCNVVLASDYDSYPEGILVDATTTLRISSVEPSALQTRDWNGSVTYTFTIVDGNGTPVSGAAVGGQDNLRGIGVFLATSSTNGNGQGTYTTTVPVGATNSIFDIIFLSDKAGYTGSAAVTRQVQVNHFQDSSPPFISINSPTTNSIYDTNASSVSLAGTASDNVGVTQVTWTNDRGGSGTASGTSNWTANITGLQSGANVLTVTAQDAAGNIGTTTLSVIYASANQDFIPPAPTITSPTTALNFETNSNLIALGGTASDNIGVTQVTWTNDRGGSGTASGTTNWTVSGINLQSGFNVLTIVARDSAGNIGTADLVINYKNTTTDNIGPNLVITSPSDSQTVSASSITISGTASDAGTGDNGILSVTVNRVQASGGTATGTGTANWSQTIALSQGTNTITVIATDGSTSQNSTTKTFTIIYQPTVPQSAWLSLDGWIDMAAVASNADGRLEVFVRGKDGVLYHRGQLTPTSDTWSAWSSLEGGIDRLAVAKNQDGRLEVFVRGLDGILYHKWQTSQNSNNWSGWASLEGGIDNLVVVNNSDGRLAVFVRGKDGVLYHRSQIAPNSNIWGSWLSLGGGLDKLAVGRNLDGRLEVFVRGIDKALYHRAQLSPGSDAWSNWSSLGGGIDMLEVGRNLDGRLEVFARGLDGVLYHKAQVTPNSGEWGGWASLEGGIDRLAVASNADGRLEVFVRGKDGILYHKWQNSPNSGNWSGWSSLEGGIDTLVVGHNQNGYLEVFVSGIDHILYHRLIVYRFCCKE